MYKTQRIILMLKRIAGDGDMNSGTGLDPFSSQPEICFARGIFLKRIQVRLEQNRGCYPVRLPQKNDS